MSLDKLKEIMYKPQVVSNECVHPLGKYCDICNKYWQKLIMRLRNQTIYDWKYFEYEP